MELDKRVDVDESRINRIRRSLSQVLTAGDDSVVKVTRAVTRQARMFTTKTRVDFNPSTSHEQTVLDLVAADRPGLLSTVGQIFMQQGIIIASAKIMTIGERAEDVFYISNDSGQALDERAQDELRKALLQQLDRKPG